MNEVDISACDPFRDVDEMLCLCLCSCLREQTEDLRRRLGCSTHKLQTLQSESESTRQYLETELRRAQDQLDKFTEKLRRSDKQSIVYKNLSVKSHLFLTVKNILSIYLT